VEDQSAADKPRKSRARERHERRKGTQPGMARPINIHIPQRAPRQLRPAGGFKLPAISLPQGRTALYIVGAVIFVGLVVLFVGRLRNNAPATEPNAIWLGTQWTYDNPDQEAVTSLGGRLRDHGVGTAYAWVSLLRPNGAWSDTAKFDAVRFFVQQFKQAAPQTKLFGWLSISATDESGANRLGDTKVQQTVADFSQRVINEFGFDGIFLNIVPVADNDENFLVLLRKVRATIGVDRLMGIAVPPDWTPEDGSIPLPPRIAPGAIWQTSYKQKVALLADQIAVMAFNTGLASSEAYTAWVGYQVTAYARALADLDTSTQIIIGVPMSANKMPDHDPLVENVPSATNGIRAGLLAAGDSAKYIKGIGLYAEWDMDNEKWSQVKREWLER
jgi:hypothetical protein